MIGNFFKWLFVAFNVAMLAWLITGVMAASEVKALTEAQRTGKAIGIGLGVSAIVVVWVIGDLLLGLFVLLTRPSANGKNSTAVAKSPAERSSLHPAMAALVVLLGGVTGLGIFVGYRHLVRTPVDSDSSVAPPMVLPLQAEPEIEVDAIEVASAYDTNEIGADNKYRNKILVVTGTVQSVNKDFSDVPYVSLKGIRGDTVRCTFASPYPPGLSELKKGQKISLRCRGDSYLLGARLSDCAFK